MNVMDYVSTSVNNLCIVMPAMLCDFEALLAHPGLLTSMTPAERMRWAGCQRCIQPLHRTSDLTEFLAGPHTYQPGRSLPNPKPHEL